MRTAVTVLLWIVATVAMTLGIGASWATVNVQSESGFVALASELGNDRKVQVPAAELTGTAFVEQANVIAFLRPQVKNLVTNTMIRLTDSAGWDQAWQETVRRTHRDLFAGPTPTSVQVDLAPLVGLALEEATASLPITLTAPEELPVTVSNEDPSELIATVAKSSTTAVVAAGVAAIAIALALAISRRRSTTFAALGFSAILAAGFWYVAGRKVAPKVIEQQRASTPEITDLLHALSNQLVASLDSWLLPIAAAGAIVFALGAITRLVRR